MIGSLRRVALREVWSHEAQDFTTWLEGNIDELNSLIDLSLSIVEREHPAGNFSVDLVAEDESGDPVIIENQLELSNHDHLGKLITYLTAINAKAAIWIVKEARPEHVRAISWLNEASSASFYLLKLEAVQIEDSHPAPLLTPMVGPSVESQEVGETKKELAGRADIRHRFWTQLLERAGKKTKLFADVSPSSRSLISRGAGMRGLSFGFNITKRESMVALSIARPAESENEEIFDRLEKSKEKIEEAFGEQLEWQRLEGQSTCRISKQFSLGGYRDDEEQWSKIQDAMIDGMIRLEAALKPHIDRLPA